MEMTVYKEFTDEGSRFYTVQAEGATVYTGYGFTHIDGETGSKKEILAGKAGRTLEEEAVVVAVNLINTKLRSDYFVADGQEEDYEAIMAMKAEIALAVAKRKADAKIVADEKKALAKAIADEAKAQAKARTDEAKAKAKAEAKAKRDAEKAKRDAERAEAKAEKERAKAEKAQAKLDEAEEDDVDEFEGFDDDDE